MTQPMYVIRSYLLRYDEPLRIPWGEVLAVDSRFDNVVTRVVPMVLVKHEQSWLEEQLAGTSEDMSMVELSTIVDEVPFLEESARRYAGSACCEGRIYHVFQRAQ